MKITLFALLLLHLGDYANPTVVIADNSMSRMIELTTREPYCHVHTDRGKIRNMLLSSDPRKVRQMSDDSITKLVDVCRTHQVSSAHQGGFIYPGTKWCGPGQIAQNFTDLGYHNKEDMCCRDHDTCSKNLKPGECRQGICNDSGFTRSHCDCDATFRRCLQNVNTETANTIGAIFFNVVQVICFKERSPCSQLQNSTFKTTTPPDIDIRFGNEKKMECNLQFAKVGRYFITRYPIFHWRNKFEAFFNILLRKFRLLNGYTQAQSDEVCSQWKYRPSEKYVPLMPRSF